MTSRKVGKEYHPLPILDVYGKVFVRGVVMLYRSLQVNLRVSKIKSRCSNSSLLARLWALIRPLYTLKMTTMYVLNKYVLSLGIVFLWLLCAAGRTYAQCDTSRLDIPRNGIDEDCDGWDGTFLQLPPYVYMTEGQDFELYFRNTILSRHPQDYFFTVSTTLPGTASRTKWSIVPTWSEVGTHPLKLYVRTPTGTILDSASTVVRVSPAAMPKDASPKKVLLLGHSFFEQGYLPKYILDRTRQQGNPVITFHGKNETWADSAGKHEGYGGWTWQRFAMDPKSPLRYNGRVNMRRYFDDITGKGKVPDWIIIHLDINDFCGYSSLKAYTLPEIDDTITVHWDRYARPLLDSIKAAAPAAKIAICYTPPPHSSQATFSYFYKGFEVISDRWRWMKIVSRIATQNTLRYGNREKDNFYLIPSHLDLNDTLEYTKIDAIHPDPAGGIISNPSGYREIAKSIYAWMRFAATVSAPPPANKRWYRDADNDNYGNPERFVDTPTAPTGYTADNTDCDDNNAGRNPAMPEIPANGIDEDCDGLTDEDSTPPVARCVSNVTVVLGYDGKGLLTPEFVNAGSHDSGRPIQLSISQSAFDCRHAGNRTVQLTVTDDSGNKASCTVPLRVVDNQPPIVTTIWQVLYLRMIDSVRYTAAKFSALARTDDLCLDQWESTFDSIYRPADEFVWFSCDLLKTKPQPLTLRIRAKDRAGNISEPTTIRVILQGCPTGIPERSNTPGTSGAAFAIFPNPTRHTLYVQAQEAIARIDCFDTSGRLVSSQQDTNDVQGNVDTSAFAPGLYSVRAQLASGQVLSKRFVVMR